MTRTKTRSAAGTRAFEALTAGARPAVEAALDASLAGYDRRGVLARFHRLTRATIDSPAPEDARLVLREIERALRAERARGGQWDYDLNRHIALLVAHRAESARLEQLTKARARDAVSMQRGAHCLNSADCSADSEGQKCSREC
jgi:hypothetical protein